MPNMLFRGAIIRDVDLRRDEGGNFCRLHVTADFSEPIREEMEWDDPGDAVKSAKLDGKLAGTKLIFSPNDKKLKDHEIELGCEEVNDFQYHRVKTDGGGIAKEVRFIVRTAERGAGALLENYMAVLGEAPAAMKLQYTEQEDLDLQKDEPIEAHLAGEALAQHKGIREARA
jgi:hypothetical protein